MPKAQARGKRERELINGLAGGGNWPRGGDGESSQNLVPALPDPAGYRQVVPQAASASVFSVHEGVKCPIPMPLRGKFLFLI